MLYDFFESTISYFTDPNGLGFPILIATGLGVILYMMNASNKSWEKADRNVEEKKDSINKINYPQKPF